MFMMAAINSELDAAELGALVLECLAIAGISQKAAAITMGIGEGQFSRQVHGRGEHLSTQRLLRLPRTFWLVFLPKLADRFGLQVIAADVTAIAVARLLDAASGLVGTMRMASAETPERKRA